MSIENIMSSSFVILGIVVILIAIVISIRSFIKLVKKEHQNGYGDYVDVSDPEVVAERRRKVLEVEEMTKTKGYTVRDTFLNKTGKIVGFSPDEGMIIILLEETFSINVEEFLSDYEFVTE